MAGRKSGGQLKGGFQFISARDPIGFTNSRREFDVSGEAVGPEQSKERVDCRGLPPFLVGHES